MKVRTGRRAGYAKVSLAKAWRSDFAAFLAHIGPMPRPGLTVDRIDNAKGYEPGNVRWATRKEQSRNMSTNHLVQFQGETMILTDAADRAGLDRNLVAMRVWRGWPIERALATPPRSKGPMGGGRVKRP